MQQHPIHYQALPQRRYEDPEGYGITTLREEDIENIRLWRNAQIEVLRQQAPLSPEEQRRYFSEVIRPDFSQERPKQILFSFLLNNRCIGYGGLTNIDWISSRAEVSFLVDPSRAHNNRVYEQDFSHFLELLCKVAFEELKLHRLFAETYIFRTATLAILKGKGFKVEGMFREHVFKQDKWHHSVLLGLLASEYLPHSTSTGKQGGILITSIGNKAPLISAVRDAAAKSGSFHRIHGCDSDPTCAGQYCVDSFWHCPVTEKLTVQMVTEYCIKNHITAIIPTRDGELEFFSRHAPEFKAKEIHVMVSEPEALSICRDKLAFSKKLGSEQLPAIPTADTIDAIKATRYVVKEQLGAGGRMIGLNLTKKEAAHHATLLTKPVFQPYIEGKEWSVDLYRTREGKVLGCVARLRDNTVAGESQVTTTQSNPALERLCSGIADLLRLYGHAVFQVIEDAEGRFHIVECNPRFGGASTASIAAGLDSFSWFLMESQGVPADQLRFHRIDGELRQVRHPVDTTLFNLEQQPVF